MSSDGSVHIDFAVVNGTDVGAFEGDITLHICDTCKFAKEPDLFAHPKGEIDTQRYLQFQRILPRTHSQFSADVIPPPVASGVSNAFLIGINYRCKTCIIPKESSKGTVYTLR